MSLDEFEHLRLLEALLFAAKEPVQEKTLRQHFPEEADLRALLAKLPAKAVHVGAGSLLPGPLAIDFPVQSAPAQ